MSSTLLHFHVHRQMHPSDEIIFDIMKATALTGRRILSDMLEKIAWVKLGEKHNCLEMNGSDFVAFVEAGTININDVAEFEVFRLDFIENYWRLLQVYSEVCSMPSVHIVGYKGRFFCLGDELLAVVINPAPDIVKAFDVRNAFGNRDDVWLQQAILDVYDTLGNRRLLEVFWDVDWSPHWYNVEPSPVLTDILHTLIGSPTTPSHVAIELYDSYHKMELTERKSRRKKKTQTEWRYVAENGDVIRLKVFMVGTNSYGVGAWINDKPIQPSVHISCSLSDYLEDLVGDPVWDHTVVQDTSRT